MTGGKFFQAADAERAEERVRRDRLAGRRRSTSTRELTAFFTAAGALLLLAGAGLSMLWFARMP